MDPHRPNPSRPPMARSPTLRPDPRHHNQRLSETATPDAIIKIVRDFQRPQDGGSGPFNAHHNVMQGAISPNICKRKAVLPAIGASTTVTDSQSDNSSNSAGNSVNSNTSLHVDPTLSIGKAGFGSHVSNNLNQDVHGYTNVIDTDTNETLGQNPLVNLSFSAENENDNPNTDFGYDDGEGVDINERSNEDFTPAGCEDYLPPSTKDSFNDDYPFQDSSAPFHGLGLPSRRSNNKACSSRDAGHHTGGVGLMGANDDDLRFEEESRRGYNHPGKTFITTGNDEEAHFGDDSMLKPVSHQSVVAEDKLVSSRCRRPSKLLDTLMLSDYNSGARHAPATSMLLAPAITSSNANNNTSKVGDHRYNSSKRFFNMAAIAGHMVRPRTLPHLPPILKRQRTLEPLGQRSGEFHLEHVALEEMNMSGPMKESRGAELGEADVARHQRPSAPSPSLTPPSPHSQDCSDCDDDVEDQLADDQPVDFIDCR